MWIPEPICDFSQNVFLVSCFQCTPAVNLVHMMLCFHVIKSEKLSRNVFNIM